MVHYALVTGGARGIGAAIARRLRADGLKVIVADLRTPEHDDYDQALTLDLSDIAAPRAALTPLAEKLPLPRLVNNAGIVMPALIEDTDPASLDTVSAVNLRAPIVCLQALLPAMKREGVGRVVNISSRTALGKEVRTVYSATKAGLIGMTKTWALELGAHGITVNAVGPGPIRTQLFEAANPPGDPRTQAIIDRVPVRRLGTPEDVAGAVGYLCSEGAGFVTGQVLYVCGGMTVGGA